MYRKENIVENLPFINVAKGLLLINWIGQAGFLIKTPEGSIICIDPYLSNSVEKFEGPETRRMWFPSFSMEEFKPDVVICTHDHLDHTDPETLPLIAAYSNAIFFGPGESCIHMSRMNIDSTRIKEMVIGQEYQFEDVRFKAVFAKHTQESIGIIIEVSDIKIYITGDTEYCDELFEVKKEKPDLLIACINGKYGNLNAEEACNLAFEIGVSAVLPMHFGLIPSNTVRPDDFEQKCAGKGIQCFILKPESNYFFTKTPKGIINLEK